ncbi:hypothetical protein F3J13_38080, partial [Burkholderia sp. Tr-849]
MQMIVVAARYHEKRQRLANLWCHEFRGPNREPSLTRRAPLAVRHVPTFSRCDVPMTTVLPSGDAPLLPLDAPL